MCWRSCKASAGVDFIPENRLGKLTGIELRASSTVDGKDFKGYLKLKTPHVAFIKQLLLQ